MTMKIITVNDPEDKLFPLDKETYFDPAVYYHGTSRAFSSSIEKDGFKQNGHVYDMEDMAELYRIGEPMYDTMPEEIQVYHGRLVWTIGSGGQHIGNKPVSFSGNYWVARNYSIRNPGCETIKLAVNVARWISGLPSCPQQEIAEKILKVYGSIFDGHVPCVYAARLPPENGRKDGWENVEKLFGNSYGKPGKNANPDHSVENDIPKESIIARIVLPIDSKQDKSGTEMGLPVPIPDTWDC